MQAATVASMQDQMPVASAVNAAAHPHSRATASPVTLATGSAAVLCRQPLHPLQVRAAACEASTEHPVRDADNLRPGVRAKALMAHADLVASSRRGRPLRGSLLPQILTTSGGPGCAPTRLSSRPHLHPMSAHHRRQHLSLLLLPADPA